MSFLTRVLDGIVYTPKEDGFYNDTATTYYVSATLGDQSWSSVGYDNKASLYEHERYVFKLLAQEGIIELVDSWEYWALKFLEEMDPECTRESVLDGNYLLSID